MKFFSTFTPSRRLPLCLSILMLLPACAGGPGTAPDTGGRTGGTAVLGIRQDVDTFNLYSTASLFTQEVADLLFLRLAREQPDFQDHPPSFLPELARSWEFSEDGLSITFRLRDDIRWSDGVPTTASDVRYTWEISRSPEVAWVNADVKDFIEDVEVLDDYTVRFQFSLRYPYQLMDANDGNIYPRHILEKIPVAEWRSTDWSRILAFNGPFLLEEWKSQDSITLVRNPEYFEDGKPGLDRVVFRIVPDPNTLLTQLLSGEIDVMADLPPREIDRVGGNDALRVLRYPDRYFQYICWNSRQDRFAHPDIRRALSYAIDMQAIIDTLLYGTAQAASSPILSLFWAHDASLQPYPHDPGKARLLLARQGWTDSDGDGWLDRDGVTFSFELETDSGKKLRTDAAVMIQSQLAKIGIRAQPRALEFNVFQRKHRDKDFDAFIAAWKVGTKVDYLKPLFHSDSIANPGTNYPSFANPRFDDLIERARTLTDYLEARPLWEEAQGILYDEQPYTLMYERQAVHGVNRRLQDVRMDSLGPFAHLKEWWIPPEERKF